MNHETTLFATDWLGPEDADQAASASFSTSSSTNDLARSLLPRSSGDATRGKRVDRSEGDGAKNDVRYGLLYAWFSVSGRSVWNSNVLTTLVYLSRRRESNPAEAVGTLTGIMGLCNVAASVPSAAAADRCSRRAVLRLGGAVSLVATATTLWALSAYHRRESRSVEREEDDDRSDYVRLTVAFALWGVVVGVAEPTVNALLADSASASTARGIATTTTTEVFTKKSLVTQFASVVGPCVALVGFTVLGDRWTIRDCAVVVAVGQFLSLPASVLLLCCFRDDANGRRGDDDDKDDHTDSTATTTTTTTKDSTFDGDDDRANESSSASEDRSSPHRSSSPSSRSRRRASLLVASSDVLSGIASGMSTRYVALFLFDDLAFSPTSVQVFYATIPLLQAALTKCAERAAAERGNCRVALGLRAVGIAATVAVVTASSRRSLAANDAPALRLVRASLLVLRAVAHNSTKALTRAALMDSVPPRERARWSAVESLTSLSWSGSAVLGGRLVRRGGVTLNLSVTALLQTMALIPLARRSIDEKEEERQHRRPERDVDEDRDVASSTAS